MEAVAGVAATKCCLVVHYIKESRTNNYKMGMASPDKEMSLQINAFVCKVDSKNEHENPNLYITVINHSGIVWTGLLRLNSHWSSLFVLFVKTPETTNQNDQCVLPILETL